MHGTRLRTTVGDVVEQVAHTGVLGALLSCAEVVVHHFLQNTVRDASTTVRYPVDHISYSLYSGRSAVKLLPLSR